MLNKLSYRLIFVQRAFRANGKPLPRRVRSFSCEPKQ